MNTKVGSTIILASMRRVCGVLTLSCLVMYLSTNVFSTIAAGLASVGVGWIVAAGGGAIGGCLLRTLETGGFIIYKSILPLIGFIIYFCLNLFFAISDPQYVAALTIGTSGGVLFSYGLGLIGYLGIQCALASDGRETGFFSGLLASIFVWFAAASVLAGYYTVDGNLQSGLLLIADNFGYQRRGDFLSIMFLLVSCMIVGLVQGGILRRSLTGWLIQLATVVVYALSIPLWLYVGQLVGSNSEVMVVGGLSLPAIAFVLIGLRYGGGSDGSITLKRVIAVGMAALGVILAIVIVAAIYFHVDVTQLRLFNFGAGGAAPTSVTTRLALLARDYLTQVNYDPLFGSMNVETLTTGAGTYAHSLPLSLISHLGLVGFLLFTVFLGVRLREVRSGGTWTATIFSTAWQSANYRLFVVLTLWVVVLMASLTTFFAWIPLWFTLGMLVPPIAMQKRSAVFALDAAAQDTEVSLD